MGVYSLLVVQAIFAYYKTFPYSTDGQTQPQSTVKVGVVYVNVCVLRCLKEELAWVIDKWLWVISNKMLFKTVVPLRN